MKTRGGGGERGVTECPDLDMVSGVRWRGDRKIEKGSKVCIHEKYMGNINTIISLKNLGGRGGGGGARNALIWVWSVQ